MPPIVQIVGEEEPRRLFQVFKENTMHNFKAIAFGLLFSVAGTVGYLLLGVVVSIIRGPVTITTGPSHATGLSAVLGGLLEGLLEATVFNPFYWLGIVLAFGLAFWITGIKFRTA